jgi:hypothetical protein
VGIISIKPDTNIAATCVRVTVEISSPKANDTKMKSSDTAISQNRLQPEHEGHRPKAAES